MIAPTERRSLLDPDVALALHIGGAESNVACGIAHFGYVTEWWSRVGDDPFGTRIVRELTERGVDASHVVVDPDRPTAVYLKDPLPERTDVYYYRNGSAASAMSPDDLASMPHGSRLVHLSGVTAAISEGGRRLLEAITVDRALGDGLVSFDVNFRPRLWRRDQAGPELRRLAQAADIAIVGRDEAEALWGTTTAEEVRDYLPDVGVLVVKDAEIGATCFDQDGAVFVPSIPVEVVEPVGAGDAFAAGYLTGVLEGSGAAVSLRLGHLLASHTLQQMGDLARLQEPDLLRRQARRAGHPLTTRTTTEGIA